VSPCGRPGKSNDRCQFDTCRNPLNQRDPIATDGKLKYPEKWTKRIPKIAITSGSDPRLARLASSIVPGDEAPKALPMDTDR
jgi:hypothetical protein